MPLIDQVIVEIEGIAVDESKSLTLKASDFRLDFIKALFAKLLKVETLTLTGAIKTLSAKSIAISGSADLLGYPNLALSMVFDVQNDEVVGTATGVFDPLCTMTLPVLTWIRVGDIVLTTSIYETFELITLAFKGNILVEKTGTKIPIEIQSQPGSGWRLGIAAGTETGITPDELVSLLSGNRLDNFIPSSLS